MEQNKDQIGAAVRGEAVALTDTEIMEALSEVQFPKPVRLPAGWVYFARAIEKKIAAKVSARAADALDSQPSGKSVAQWLRNHYQDYPNIASLCDALEGGALDSQPTDGGVRNGRDLKAVHAFLMGESPLEGVQFGDKHPTKAGAFWWRLNLRAALAKG